MLLLDKILGLQASNESLVKRADTAETKGQSLEARLTSTMAQMAALESEREGLLVQVHATPWL